MDVLPEVKNAECTACMACTSVCPVRDTLDLKSRGLRLRPRLAVLLVSALFFGIIGWGMRSGHWHTNIPESAYRISLPMLRTGPGMPHRF